nr:hypothetical protein [Tanacetum cinerariifolium]
MDLFNLISAPNPTKVKTETRPRAAHEVLLLTATTSRVIDIEDTTVVSGSSGILAFIEKSPLDFANEDPPPVITERSDEATAKVIPESGLGKEVAVMGPVVNKRHRKRGNKGAKANAPSKSTLGGTSLAVMEIEADSIGFVPTIQETPVNAKSVTDLDPLSYARPRSIPEQDITQSSWKRKSRKIQILRSLPLSRPWLGHQEDVVDHIVPPGYFLKLRHLPNDDFLSQYNINMARQLAMGSQLRLRYEQETKLLKKVVAQVAQRDQRIKAREKHIKNLEALLQAEA